ncbi:bifunctional protein GlmU-like isoform X1 [Oratosquilla oratoria]|uniref:bifunctional protein GlmU-like isoform X1 n=1 Tax=Oratosquilla oratoria TaxID=337810 RepID=UPI003F7648AB
MSLAGRKWEAKAKSFLEDYVKKNTPSGVFVLSCCGSVKSVTLRYASDPDGTTNTIETLYKYFEVLSMTGTLSQEGTHLHITLADNTGRTVGGHLVGNLMVQTTMEVKNFLEEYAKKMAPFGIFVLSCCGYLNCATLHFASNENGATKEASLGFSFVCWSLPQIIDEAVTSIHVLCDWP